KVSDFNDTRNIYMNVGGSLAAFSYSNLSAAQKATFQSSFLSANLSQWSYLVETLSPAQLATVAGENLLNYIRGQKGYEETSSDPGKRFYRKRQAVLGDIVDSTPKFIGRPTFSYSDPGYANFKSAQDNRTGMVYVGGNDGMLHAFDGETLQERWAYVPSMVIPNLWRLADTAYATKHAYFVNGAPTISDICVSGCNGSGAVWKTILVGGLNGGGRGYYALDITNPNSPSLLWEFDASDEPNLGFTFGNPIVTKNPDGKWVVLVTSGYNNIPDNSAFYSQEGVKFKPNPPQFNTGDGKGYLYILDAATGTKLKQITTGVGTPSLPSGLAKISAWTDDPEVNNTTTYVYGGDLLGNLWRFDLANDSVLKLASFGVSQPITTAPELGQIRKKRVVFVGTGKYLEVSDLLNTDQQTLYAIKDDDMETTLSDPKSSLVQQTIVPDDGANVRTSDSSNDGGNLLETGLGWYIDFPDTGERQNVASELVLGTLLVPTTVPTASACQPAGYGWLNFLDYRSGRAVPDAEGVVSARSNAPIVGFNVVSIGGKPKVNIVTADNPNPELIDFIKFSGSGTGFQKTRAIWRELIRKQ
ncbi:MAG TPA: PilC/PilY family type IV pilus protein, partial [Methylophilaceae bacterium]